MKLVLYGGRVRTMDPVRPLATAVAVEDGRVAAVGGDELLEFCDNRVDLRGRTLLPGFNDAHLHVWKVGHLITSLLDLRRTRSLDEIVDMVAERAGVTEKDHWILGRGFNEVLLREGRLPTRHDLDKAAPHHPVYLTRTCGHIAVANTRALAQAGVAERPDPKGGVILREADGHPSGVLHETAMGIVLHHVPQPSAAEYEATILAAARRHLAMGITSVTEAGVPLEILDVYHKLDAANELPYRVNAMALRRALGGPEDLPLPQRHVSDFLRIDTVKLFADGGLSGQTAALSVPYRDGSRGILRMDAEAIHASAVEAVEQGLRIATHAIGDDGIAVTLDAYERLGSGHRIEHFGLPSPQHIAQARRLEVDVTLQPVFVHTLGANFRAALPDAMLAQALPVRAMLEAGLNVAFSSDAPVVADESPLLGIQAALQRRDVHGEPIAPDQAVTVEEALYAYTMGSARASGDSYNRGSISPGKWADLVVLQSDPVDADPAGLASIAVDMTFVGGNLRYGG